jgi:hypothetical protein
MLAVRSRPLSRRVTPLVTLSIIAAMFPLSLFAQATASTSQPAGWVKEFGTMWTFDAPPLAYWKARYGFTPDQAWLDHVRLSSIRIPGCSASFVSSAGLVMTNHHCGRDCTAGASPRDSNYVETGFAAASLGDEKKCANMFADQLRSITNVTDRIRKAVTATTPAKQVEQRNAEIDRIQKECAQQPTEVCEVVTFYQGGMYSLYKYRHWTDVRLVMAPEEGIAFYGGDPDNFTYPRYDLDLTLLRVYENGQPLSPRDFLKWSANGAAGSSPSRRWSTCGTWTIPPDSPATIASSAFGTPWPRPRRRRHAHIRTTSSAMRTRRKP